MNRQKIIWFASVILAMLSAGVHISAQGGGMDVCTSVEWKLVQENIKINMNRNDVEDVLEKNSIQHSFVESDRVGSILDFNENTPRSKGGIIIININEKLTGISPIISKKEIIEISFNEKQEVENVDCSKSMSGP